MSLLKVKIADEYRIDKPVEASARLAPPGQGPAPPPLMELDLERTVMQEGASGNSEAASFLTSSSSERHLPDPALETYMEMGFSRAHAALALSYCSSARVSPDKAVEFANNLAQLTAMGFSLAVAAGALLKYSNDVNRATEACLSAA